MSKRKELEGIARGWISLWNAPVNWVLYDRLHAEDFEDLSPANRSSRSGRVRFRDAGANGTSRLIWNER